MELLEAWCKVKNIDTALRMLEKAMEKPESKTLEVVVNVPRDSIPVKLVVMQCAHCGMLCALENSLA